MIGVLPFFHIYGHDGAREPRPVAWRTVVTMPRFELDEFLR